MALPPRFVARALLVAALLLALDASAAAHAGGQGPADAADPTASAPVAEAPDPERVLEFRLDAAAGIPGSFRVPVDVERPGVWVFELIWEGRDLVFVALEDERGARLYGQAETSPARFAVEVGPGLAAEQPRWTLIFRPQTARSELRGLARIVRPESAAARAEREAAEREAARPRFVGRGACLERGWRDDASGRALVDLAGLLERGEREAEAWLLGWVEELLSIDARRAAGEPPRRALFDRLFKVLRADTPPSREAERTLRALFVAAESLVRDESQARDAEAADAAAARRRALFDALSCLFEDRARGDEASSSR